jgi:PhnB protein
MMGEGQGIKNFPAMLHLYMEDVDAVYQRAIAAGAKSLREPADQPYGDRTGAVEDAFGNQWWIATHTGAAKG